MVGVFGILGINLDLAEEGEGSGLYRTGILAPGFREETSGEQRVREEMLEAEHKPYTFL